MATVVDLSCSGLVVATTEGSAILSPVVAAVSDLGGASGSARVECSDRVDAFVRSRPERCLLDPCSGVDRPRAWIAGTSVPTVEVLSAPVARALGWAGSAPADPLTLIVPGHWGAARVRRLHSAAARHRTVSVTVRAALATVEALSAAAARWVVCVEGERSGWVLTLVGRDGDGLAVADRRLVPSIDPVLDLPRDVPTRRVVEQIGALRRDNHAARSGSFEVVARGFGAEAVVDGCDLARIPATLVAPEVTAEAAARLIAPGVATAR